VGVVVSPSPSRRGYRLWWEREGASPAEQMRSLLAEYRRAGLSFPHAWVFALSRIRWGESQRQQYEWLRAWDDPTILGAWELAYHRSSFGGFGLEEDAAETVAFREAHAQELHGPQHYTAPFMVGRRGAA
jgi:hypothetical protein